MSILKILLCGILLFALVLSARSELEPILTAGYRNEIEPLEVFRDSSMHWIKDTNVDGQQREYNVAPPKNNLYGDLEKLHQHITALGSSEKISNLKLFIQYFDTRVKAIERLPPVKRVIELEKKYLHKLREALDVDGVLIGGLYYLYDHKTVIVQSMNDENSFTYIELYLEGVKFYIQAFLELFKQNSFLALYYYQNGDIEKFNGYLITMELDYMMYRVYLFGGHEGPSLLAHAEQLLKEVKQSPIFNIDMNRQNELLRNLYRFKDLAMGFKMPVIPQQPDSVTQKPDFSSSTIDTPFGIWNKGTMVSYAVQLYNNVSYSKLSEWSEPFTVGSKACPKVYVPRDLRGRTRLIYRKINYGRPHLVAMLTNATQSIFHDINWDLSRAARNDDEETALAELDILLKEADVNVNARLLQGEMPIHAAARAGNVRVAEKLLRFKQSIDVNALTFDGQAPLHFAVNAGYKKFVEWLVKNGADVNMKNSLTLQTPLHVAAYRDNDKLIKYLLGCDSINTNVVDIDDNTPLHTAVFGVDGAAMAALLASKKFNVNLQGKKNGLTALHFSSHVGNERVVDLLLNESGIAVNIASNVGWTALHYAVMSENLNIVKKLLDLDEINPNAVDVNGWTALHLAVHLQNYEITAELLYMKNIDVNIKTKYHQTPAEMAAILPRTDIQQLFKVFSWMIDFSNLLRESQNA